MRGTLLSIGEKFGAVVKDKATKAINEGSLFVFENVSKHAQAAYKNRKSAAILTARTASKETSGSLDRIYKQGKDVTLSQVTSATTKASDVVRGASSSLASRARTASQAASHVVREASVSMAASAKEAAKEAAIEAKNEAKRGFRWLLIWSLVAVGVYGVATTVAKELVRHALVGTKREDSMTENKQSEQSNGTSGNSGRWSWLASTEAKTLEHSSKGDASGNSGRWSWLSSTEHKASRGVDASGSGGRWLSWGGKSS